MFVSYSQKDSSTVGILVELLRVVGPSVFRDKDSIAPGLRWRTEIARALDTAHVVVVFWSANSAASTAVRGEYERALADKKRVVPVLLDSTPIAPSLAEYQWIDLRGAWEEAQAKIAAERKLEAIPLPPGLTAECFGSTFGGRSWEDRQLQVARQLLPSAIFLKVALGALLRPTHEGV